LARTYRVHRRSVPPAPRRVTTRRRSTGSSADGANRRSTINAWCWEGV
jgi:hypothetical protein